MLSARKQQPAKTVFWGCAFNNNLPFIIQTTDKVFRILGLRLKELDGWGCCPDPTFIKSYDQELHLALAARNLALAEKKDNELLVFCNGCYNTLNEAAKELKDKKIRDEINTLLPKKKTYDGKLQVKHALNTFNDNIREIKDRVKIPLNGLTIAVHYGCHALRPPAVSTDNPDNPKSLDNIVEATGAESILYGGKLDCCGVPEAGFNPPESVKLLQKKLVGMRESNVDCIVTACPACFMQFDRTPKALKNYALPVLHIGELVGLSFGFSPEELFLEKHATDVAPVLEKIGVHSAKKHDIEGVKKYFNLTLLGSHCEACTKECTMAESTRDTLNVFDPIKTVKLLLDGRLEKVLQSQDIWLCLQCGKCEIRCPNNMGLKSMFNRLRELAVERGIKPPSITEKIKMLEETGYGVPEKEILRKKLGMKPVPKADTLAVKKIMKNLEKKKKR